MVEALQPFQYDPSTGQITARAFSPGIITTGTEQPSNAFMAGLRSGGDQLVSAFGGAAAAAGQTLGSQGIQDFGVDLSQRYRDFAAKAARPDLENSYGPAGLVYKGGQLLPSLAGMLGGALVGGALSGGNPLGAFAGGAAMTVPQSVGEFMNTAMEQPGGAEPGAGARALALGIPLGGLMAAAPPGLKSGVEGVAKTALKDGLTMGGIMGVQSGVSTAVDQTFRNEPGSFTDRAQEIVKSALGGFAMGGITGGAIGGVKGMINGRSSNADLAKAVDANVRPEPDAAAGRGEPLEGTVEGGAAPNPPTPAAPLELGGPAPMLALPAPPPRQLEAPLRQLPAPDRTVRTLGDHTNEELQAIHDTLSAKTERTPLEDQLIARIEGEVNSRNATPNPDQGQLDLGGTPVGEQPVSRAVRQQQETAAEQQQALAARRQEFVDQAKDEKGKPTYLSKILEREPVDTPEDFAAKVYNDFNDSTSMRKVADKLGLLDSDGKLFTPESIQKAREDAYTTLLNPTQESTALFKKLDNAERLIEYADQKRAANEMVPQFDPQARETAGDFPEFKTSVDNVREPGLPLDVTQPLPLEGFQTRQDMIRTLSGKPDARTNTKAPTNEAEIVRMMNTKELAPLNKPVLEKLGLVRDGERVPLDDAISRLQEQADAAQAKNDPVARGKVQANIDQLQKIKVIDDFQKAQDQIGKDIPKSTSRTAFQTLETLRRQLPPEWVNAAERVKEMHNDLIADKPGVSGRATQLIGALKSHLDPNNKTLVGDLTPLSTKQAAGEPSQAAIDRAKAIEARPQPKGRQAAATDPSSPEMARMARPELRTPMDDDIEHLISSGGRTSDLLAHIAEKSDDPFRRQLAQEFAKRGYDADVKFASPEGVSFEASQANHPDAEVTGSLSADGKRINIYDRAGMEDTIMHEAVHVGTQEKIANGTGQAVRQMDKLFKRILDVADIINPDTGKPWYGMSNLKEFVAEAFTNPRFQEFLKTQKSDSGSRLGNMWQDFKNVVFKALGLPERMRTALNDAIEGGYRIMDEAPVARDGVGSVPDAVRQTNAMMDEMPRVREKVEQYADQATAAIKSGKSVVSSAINGAKTLYNNISSRGTIARRVTDEELRTHAMRFVDLGHARSAQFRQWAGLNSIANDGFSALEGKLRVMVADLHQFDALRIDPRKDWASHPWLHDQPEMKAEVDRGNEIYRKLKQMNDGAGATVFDNMITHNDVSWRGAHVVDLEKLARPFIEELGLKNFGEAMSNKFQNMDALHHDLAGASAFVKDEYASKMGELKAALGRKADEVSGLQSQGKITEARTLEKQYAGLAEWVAKTEQSVTQSEQYPNFHKGRYGDWALTAHFNTINGKLDANAVRAVKARVDKATGGDTIFHVSGDNPKIFMRFENRDQAGQVHDILEKAREEGLLDQGKELRYQILHKEMDSNASQAMKDLFDQVTSSDLYKSGDKAAQEALNEAKSAFMAAYLDLMPDNAVSNIMQRRHYTQGSSGEVMRNFITRNQILAHKITSGTAQPLINDAIGAMRGRLDAMETSSKPLEIDDATRDYRSLLQYENEAPKRVNDGFIDMMRSFNHAYFLGFSPSYVLMQTIQPWQTALPELGKHFGYATSAKEMGKAYPEVAKLMKTIIAAPSRVDGTITRKMLLDAGHDAKLVDIVMRGVNDGTIEAGGATRELGKVASGTEGTWHGKVTRYANTLPMLSETASRLAVHIAADRLFEANPSKARIPGYKFDPNGSPAELAKAKAAYVRYAVQESMGRYGSGEAPKALSDRGFLGPATPLAGALMRYSFSMLEKVIHETGVAFDRTAANKNEAIAARKYLAGHTAAMAVIAGSMGVPFFNAVTGLATKGLNLATGQDNWDVAGAYRGFLSDIFGPTVGDVIARGLPRAIGIDLGHLGEQDLLPLTQIIIDRRKIDDQMSDLGKTFVGSPGSMMLGIAKGIEEMYQGRPLDGAIEGAPVALRNALKAYKLSDRGYVDSSNRDINIDSGPTDVMLQAMGIKAAQPANYAEAEHEISQLKASRQQRSSSLMKNLLDAYERGDSEDQRRALMAARKYDLDHKNAPISKNLPGNLLARQKATGTAAAINGPLDLPAFDAGMRHQLRYYNN